MWIQLKMMDLQFTGRVHYASGKSVLYKTGAAVDVYSEYS